MLAVIDTCSSRLTRSVKAMNSGELHTRVMSGLFYRYAGRGMWGSYPGLRGRRGDNPAEPCPDHHRVCDGHLHRLALRRRAPARRRLHAGARRGRPPARARRDGRGGDSGLASDRSQLRRRPILFTPCASQLVKKGVQGVEMVPSIDKFVVAKVGGDTMSLLGVQVHDSHVQRA